MCRAKRQAADPMNPLCPVTRAYLLQLARATAGTALGQSSLLSSDAGRCVPYRGGGLFVSLWNQKQLRGCVGAIRPTVELSLGVRTVTPAAIADPRFRDEPITAFELPEITFEITLLSDPQKATDPEALIPGVHGVIVRRDRHSGCFLPKVATERRWLPGEFLSYCCTLKAGLPADAWRDVRTDVLLFTVESFREPEQNSRSYNV